MAVTVEVENAWTSEFSAPSSEINIGSTTNYYSDGEYLPILKVQPVYPRSALQKGMFGWVLVEFMVDELGRVEPIETAGVRHLISFELDEMQRL